MIHDERAPSSSQVPPWAAVHLTHAALQAAADAADVDILHIKGPTDAADREGTADSIDADVLVRPAHLDRFIGALESRGWWRAVGFEEGSPFEHAANYRHPAWAWADLHRFIPGVRLEPEDAFDRLWRERVTVEIAHWPCAAPALRGQVLIRVMHVARSHGSDEPTTWRQASDEVQASVRELARELRAEVAFAAGIGELDSHRHDRDYALWRFWSQPDDSRLVEWAARWRSAEGFRARWRVVVQAVRVNRAGLRVRLGREPTAADIAREWMNRLKHAAVSFRALLARRTGGE